MGQDESASIVVGVDGTTGSLGALRYAAHAASQRGCGVYVIHVGMRYDPTFSVFPRISKHIDVAGRAILDYAEKEIRRVAPDLDVTTVLREGSRITELVECATLGGLMVLGRETQSGLDRLVFGATTAAVAARTDVPTVVVGAEWEPSPSPGPVVVGLREAAASDVLFEAAFEAAADSGVGVEVVHAWKVPDAYIDLIETRSRGDEWLAAGTDLIEREVADWRERYPQVPVTVRVVHEWPSDALVAAGDTASLVVVLRRPTHRPLGAHLGSTARSVIGVARCPVQVMPSPQSDDWSWDLELERSGDVLT